MDSTNIDSTNTDITYYVLSTVLGAITCELMKQMQIPPYLGLPFRWKEVDMETGSK